MNGKFQIVHEVVVVPGFVPLIVEWGTEDSLIFLIASVLAAGWDSMFAIMQWYNRPRTLKNKGKDKIRKREQ